MPLLLVMLGGALGAGARHLLNDVMLAWIGRGFPWGTLIVNILGGLCAGLLLALLARHGAPEPWRLFLGVGLLGGFTTFSAFSVEVVAMAEAGQPTLAIGYAALSVGAATAAVVVGAAIARALT
jgi:fluoride exporter